MQLKWPMRWDLFSLFPAYAGVIPHTRFAARKARSFPRIRGGDPRQRQLEVLRMNFSPHTRG